ncbi:hypothetical protein L5515_016648 [Caenorhabditis briggsae]|uniref:Uncharacterized protein n=1 Tax=Caenorhabditis briggsae TaxID=6238 RepID=A0AAE9F6K5_CAEBR|nr:hypothetical protein L5515_016648 [Caenorhabditis briggsae]
MRRKLELFLLLAFVGTGYVTYWMTMESQKFDTLYDFGEYLCGRGYNETEKGWKVVSTWVAHNLDEFLIWSGYKKRDVIKEVEEGVDLDAVRTTVLPPITLPTPTTTTTNAPGMRTCAQCTGGNYHLRRWLMQSAEHGQSMGWVEEWALTDCVIGKIRYNPCATTCMKVTIQKPENGEKLDSIMMDCADDMFYSTPDIPDTRPWYKSQIGPMVFEENARYVSERIGHTIIYEFNTTSSDNASTIADNLKEQFAYVKQEKKLGDNNKGLFIVVTMLTIFLLFASCCYCIYCRCKKWRMKREWKKNRSNPKYMFNENTEEMVDLAVYMEQGLFDVPKPRDKIWKKEKYRKTVTFRADLEEIVEDIEDGFEDDSEPAERCVPEMLFHNSPRVHFDDDWEDEFDEDCEEELDEDDKEEFDEDEEESNSILEDVVERSTENLHVQE